MQKNSTTTSIHRIEKLDNRLANQIAAGEVVDRPASVLKELLENSIDAGAKRIEIEVERGGMRLIKVTDDGIGICKDDLTLALTRHATSKIKKVEDLSAIYSLGFRGEALASISSVSRLTLTSRTHDESLAWQAISEGRNMDVVIQPASSLAGTRIEVRDLFFNTPARQKFLRTERTEFLQIEDVFKRMALAHFNISFILKHNNKIIKRVPAVNLLGTETDFEADREVDKLRPFLFSKQEQSRLSVLCGKTFADLSMPLLCQHENVSIKAFIGGENCHRSESDIQFVFINNRAVKDKTLSHAIRQAYLGRLPPGRMPTYIIYLTLDAEKIDVNVHPTKHEVRFENQREIHDLLLHSITESLNKSPASSLFDEGSNLDSTSRKYTEESRSRERGLGTSNSNPRGVQYSREQLVNHSSRLNNQYIYSISETSNAYNQSSENANHDDKASDIRSSNEPFSHQFTRLGNGFSVVYSQDCVWGLQEQPWFQDCLFEVINDEVKISTMDLLFPVNVDVCASMLESVNVNHKLNALGFYFLPNNNKSINLTAVPEWTVDVDNSQIIELFCQCLGLLNQKSEISNHDLKNLMSDELINNSSIEYFIKLAANDFAKAIFQSKPYIKKIDSALITKLFSLEQTQKVNDAKEFRSEEDIGSF